jgi:hypothetical protein
MSTGGRGTSSSAPFVLATADRLAVDEHGDVRWDTLPLAMSGLPVGVNSKLKM